MTVVKAVDEVILRYESTDGGKLKGGADVGGLFGDAHAHHSFMRVSFGTGGLRCEKCTATDMLNSVLHKENSPTFEFKGGREELVVAAEKGVDGIIQIFVSDNAEQLLKEIMVEGATIFDFFNLDILTLKTRRVEQEQLIKAIKKWKQ